MSHPGIELLRQLLADGLGDGDILERRAAMDAMTAGNAAPPGVEVGEGALGGIPAEWIVPEGTDRSTSPVIVHLHGGGYCMGGPESHREFAGRLALAAACPVVVPAYRLAPEHPFPAAIDDACAALEGLAASGVPPRRTALSGDSAGGGLAVSTMVRLRDAGRELPAAAALVSPWADLTLSAPTFAELDGLDPLLNKATLALMAESYLNGTDPTEALASPVFAADLSGLPPMHIEVGELEVLLDDSRRLVALFESSGVPVSCTAWPGLTHDFQIFPEAIIPESTESIAAIAAFLMAHTGDGPTG